VQAVSPIVSHLTLICNDIGLPHHQDVEMLTQAVHGCLISTVGLMISMMPFHRRLMYLYQSDTPSQQRQKQTSNTRQSMNSSITPACSVEIWRH